MTEELCEHCFIYHERRGQCPQRVARPPLAETMNRFCVAATTLSAANERKTCIVLANPPLARQLLDHQAALSLVAWVSVLAELDDDEIVAARRQVEST